MVDASSREPREDETLGIRETLERGDRMSKARRGRVKPFKFKIRQSQRKRVLRNRL